MGGGGGGGVGKREAASNTGNVKSRGPSVLLRETSWTDRKEVNIPLTVDLGEIRRKF